MSGILWANNLRGNSAATAQSSSPNQMMCARCHMNSVCKQCDREREREGDRQTKGKKERESETPRAPLLLLLLLLLLLASPGIFSVKLFADSLWSWVPGPAADDGCPPPATPPLPPPSSTSIYVPSTPGNWTGDRGWREATKKKKIKNNTVWHEYRLARAHWWKQYTIFN